MPPIPPEEEAGPDLQAAADRLGPEGHDHADECDRQADRQRGQRADRHPDIEGQHSAVEVMTQNKVKDVVRVPARGRRQCRRQGDRRRGRPAQGDRRGVCPGERRDGRGRCRGAEGRGHGRERRDGCKTALNTTTTFTNRLNTVDDTLKGFTTFQTNILSWQSTIDGRMGGLTNEIDSKALAAVGQYQLAMQSEIDERIGVAVNTLRVGLVDQVRAEMQVVGGRGQDRRRQGPAGRDHARCARRSRPIRSSLSNKVENLDQHVGALDGQVQVATRDADRSNQRIDTVLTRARADAGGVGGVGGVRTVVDRELVDVIGNMRTSIVAAATPAQRPKVECGPRRERGRVQGNQRGHRGRTDRARDPARGARHRADVDDDGGRSGRRPGRRRGPAACRSRSVDHPLTWTTSAGSGSCASRNRRRSTAALGRPEPAGAGRAVRARSCARRTGRQGRIGASRAPDRPTRPGPRRLRRPDARDPVGRPDP